MTRSVSLRLLVCIMTLGAGGLQADVLNLADGTRLVGTLEELGAEAALVSGTFAGELSVPREAIVTIGTRAPVTVQLDDGAYLTGHLQTPEEGGMVMQVTELGSRPLPLTEVREIYREDPLTLQQQALAVEVTANANVGVSIASGNSESENLHFDGQLVTRTERNRYTLAGEYNEEEADDVLVKENWNGLVKYDHFVSEKWFWFNSATFESDEFADLELRSALAAGVGYQFFETDARSLSVEAGPSYIDENFEVAEDDSFVGARWALDYNQQLWNGLFFYHFQQGLLGLEDTEDLTVRTRTGLRLDMSDRVSARIQTAIDWDNSPPEGTASTDYEHTLTVGYRF